MPVNPLSRPEKHADVLLGKEDEDAQAKRGYATATDPTTTVLGKPLNYNDIYNTKSEPAYITKERERIMKNLPASVPSAGAVRATGLSAADALATGATNQVSQAVSAVANPYLNRASSGLNELFGTTPKITVAPSSGTGITTFGGAAGTDLPDINQLSSPELARYAELARISGSVPTAEAAKSYDSAGELGRQRFREFLQTANPDRDLGHTGLTRTAVSLAKRVNAY